MPARSGKDAHRGATALELLFDLVFVVAIASAAFGLYQATIEGNYLDGAVKFVIAFFALWWPWLQLTWFASGFDNDDASYRISIMVIMFGALLIAGSFPVFFESFDVRLLVTGYVVTRLAFIFLWHRAGSENPVYKTTSRRYVSGQSVLQVLWVLGAFLLPAGSAGFFVAIATGIVLELFVPYYASLANGMPWHKNHIMERYGLLNIIVLGEILLSTALAIQSMSKSGNWTVALITISITATIVPFVLWWLYFSEEDHLFSVDRKQVFLWSYGHFIIFASAAAIGAGFAALVDSSSAQSQGNPDIARWLISVSVAGYLFGLWFVRDRHVLNKKLPDNYLCLLF